MVQAVMSDVPYLSASPHPFLDLALDIAKLRGWAGEVKDGLLKIKKPDEGCQVLLSNEEAKNGLRGYWSTLKSNDSSDDDYEAVVLEKTYGLLPGSLRFPDSHQLAVELSDCRHSMTKAEVETRRFFALNLLVQSPHILPCITM